MYSATLQLASSRHALATNSAVRSQLCIQPTFRATRWSSLRGLQKQRGGPNTALRAAMSTVNTERKTALAERARRFMDVWYSAPSIQGNEEADFSTGQVAEQVKELLAPDVVHQADGVVQMEDVKGISAILQELKSTHHHFQHLSWQPELLAVNEPDSLVFAALQYRRMDTTPNAMALGPEDRISSGLMLKKMHFNSENKIDHILVCRQLTVAERALRMKDADACTPADLSHVVKMLGTANMPVSEEQQAKMKDAIQRFVGAWDARSSLEHIEEILAPEVKSLDGFGLHGQGKDFQNRQEAASVVSNVHDKYRDNHNQLRGWAVADNAPVGFEHWVASSTMSGGSGGFMQGLDMLIFDEECKIKEVVQFTMHPYPQIEN